MKTNTLRVLSLFLALGLVLTGCSKDPDPADGNYGSGIYVINEGNFNSSNADISFITRDAFDIFNSIFSGANTGLLLGDVAQSMTIEGDKAYIVLNNSNKVVVANATTFAAQSEITGMSMPRYVLVYNGKGYITEWTSYVGTGKLHIVNLSAGTIETSVSLNIFPEKLLAANGKIFVTNVGDSTVSVINASSGSLSATVNVGEFPNSLVLDGNGDILVLCGGFTDFGGTDRAGKISRINTSTLAVTDEVVFSNSVFHPTNLCKSGNTLYFGDYAGVYAYTTGSGTFTQTPVISRPVYGLGIDPANGTILVGDAGNFTSAGKVIRYNTSYQALDSATAGIGPNGFYFRN